MMLYRCIISRLIVGTLQRRNILKTLTTLVKILYTHATIYINNQNSFREINKSNDYNKLW